MAFLVLGILGLFDNIENGSWKYGLGIIASSVSSLAFPAIVKAAYKYLDE